MIADMIATEDPSITRADVRVIENFAGQSFSVEIAYNPTGNLAARVQRLIEDVKPAALRLTSIVWGTFRADFGQADVTPV